MRQPSDPSPYDEVLLPDMGLFRENNGASIAELNSAVALATATGEQLVHQNIAFCMAISTKQGLQLHEVRNGGMLRQLLSQWLGLEIESKSGIGLQYFLSERLEQYFTRMVIVSAGKYDQNLSNLDKWIGVTVLSTSDDVKVPSYTTLDSFCETVVLPSDTQKDDVFRVIC